MPVIKPFSTNISSNVPSSGNNVFPYSELLIYNPYFENVYSYVPDNTLLWKADERKLYRRNKARNSWDEVDWKAIVSASSDMQSGYLEINPDTGGLYVYSINEWYECIPAVGSQCIKLSSASFDTVFNYKYWIPAGQIVLVEESYSFPIVMPTKCIFDIEAFFSGGYGKVLLSIAGETRSTTYTGLSVNNTAISQLRETYYGHCIGGENAQIFTRFTLKKYYRSVETVGISSNDITGSCGILVFSNYSFYILEYGIDPYWIGVCKNSNDGSFRRVYHATIVRKY